MHIETAILMQTTAGNSVMDLVNWIVHDWTEDGNVEFNTELKHILSAQGPTQLYICDARSVAIVCQRDHHADSSFKKSLLNMACGRYDVKTIKERVG